MALEDVTSPAVTPYLKPRATAGAAAANMAKRAATTTAGTRMAGTLSGESRERNRLPAAPKACLRAALVAPCAALVGAQRRPPPRAAAVEARKPTEVEQVPWAVAGAPRVPVDATEPQRAPVAHEHVVSLCQARGHAAVRLVPGALRSEEHTSE